MDGMKVGSVDLKLRLKPWKCLFTPAFGVNSTEIALPLPRPCCRKTFLASTVGDGKSELLKEKQRKA